MPLLPFLFFLLLLSYSSQCDGLRFRGVGVNYGTLGDDLPSAARSIGLLRSAGGAAVKIYDANPAILRALSGSGLLASIMVPNQLIPLLASNQSAADAWVSANLLPFYPATRVRFLLVGNEILSDASIANSTWPALVPAIRNLHRSVKSRGIHNIKLGTTLAMDALAVSFPPSAASFRPTSPSRSCARSSTSSPAPAPTSSSTHGLAERRRSGPDRGQCAQRRDVQPQPGAADDGAPAPGDAGAAGVEMPVFVFSLFNENQKPGPGTERHWGLFNPNGTPVYEVDLTGRRPTATYPPLPPAQNNTPYKGRIWCVVAGGRKTNATELGSAVSYACGQEMARATPSSQAGHATGRTRWRRTPTTRSTPTGSSSGSPAGPATSTASQLRPPTTRVMGLANFRAYRTEGGRSKASWLGGKDVVLHFWHVLFFYSCGGPNIPCARHFRKCFKT
uniref:Glucan endo-1,3-beta-D-glucosidase n=1 Tax=Ananas comosus var. bracteatus TaxID=296719 RepID=A0A6V7Q8F9_ANACO|nr:unnamed protein product [Ananas comosus var. bracteatus]